MKLTLIIGLTFSSLFFSSISFANSDLNEIIGKKEDKQSKVKKKRRKKVEMCNECGKPETQCECEGHGEESDNHDH